MHRRRVLQATGVAATVGLAGCMGYTIESTDDVDRRKRRIDDLESKVDDLEGSVEEKDARIEELNSQIEDKKSKISELEASVEQKDGEIDSLESDLDTERRELVSKLYHLGDSHRQQAFKNWQDGSEMYDQGDYAGASNEWGIATGQYIDAVGAFSEAASVAGEQGLTEVADKIESSKNRVQTSATAANHFGLAAYNYARENASEGDKHIQEGNAALEQLDQYTLYEASEIDSDLGL